MAESKKLSPLFEKRRLEKHATLSHTEQVVASALHEIIQHLDAEGKRLASFIFINKALEFNYSKDKAAILVYFSYRSHKVLLTSLYKKLVTELEKRLKKIVLLVSARNIQSRWIKINRTQKRSNSRTLTAVYAATLDELLLPGIIISSRTRVRLDGTSFIKLVLDKSEEHFMEERVDAIKVAYKRLANRDIEIDFQKEPTFYVLKKGDKK